MKLKRREVKEKVSKTFLLSLLEPFHPTLVPGEKITDIAISGNYDEFERFTFTYVIVKEGGVKNSKELCKGDAI